MHQIPSSDPCSPINLTDCADHTPNSLDTSCNKIKLNACLFNAKSIVNKLNNYYVYSMDFSIVALTETWLTDSIFNNEILPRDFSIYRKDRRSIGGGVLLAARDCLSNKVLSSPDTVIPEIFDGINFHLKNSTHLIFIAFIIDKHLLCYHLQHNDG